MSTGATVQTVERKPTHEANWAIMLTRAIARPKILVHVAIFLAALVFILAVNLEVISLISLLGDEPWYVLLTYSLLHNHTPNVAAIVNNHALYSTLVQHFDDHTRDYLGNGERLLPNLPGYSLIILPFYALGGRLAIVWFQCALAALTTVLLFAEGTRLFGSRLAGAFAALAYVLALPALLYAGQLFPSTVAACFGFLAYLLAVRAVPGSAGRRLVWASIGLGLLLFALPWLHIKYAFAALALGAIAAWKLLPRFHALRRLRNVPTAPDDAAPAADRTPWIALAVIASSLLLSFALIALYSHRYYGTWTPQYSPQSDAAPDYLHPSFRRFFNLFYDIFLSPQMGLVPWVPLDLLVLVGFVLLWLHARAHVVSLAIAILGFLVAFAPVLVAKDIFQGIAFPSRFSVESAPYFALCVTAVFAVSLPAVRRVSKRLRVGFVSSGRRAISGPAFSSDSPSQARAAMATRAAIGVACVVLLLAGGWFALVAAHDPELIYPSPAGNRLAYRYPNLLPAWWFSRFHALAGTLTFDGREPLNGFNPNFTSQFASTATSDAQDVGGTVLGTRWLNLPPGSYTASLTFICSASPSSNSAPFIAFVDRGLVVSGQPIRPERLSAVSFPVSTCASAATQPVALTFTTNGYDQTGIRLLIPAGVVISDVYVTYHFK